MSDKEINSSENQKSRYAFQNETGDLSICIKSRFESSHYLYQYYPDGSDEQMHGHSWSVKLYVSRQNRGTDDKGMVCDFQLIQKELEKLVHQLNHNCINDLDEFKNINPTAENIVRWFYNKLKGKMREEEVFIRKISVHEGADNCAIFRPSL